MSESGADIPDIQSKFEALSLFSGEVDSITQGDVLVLEEPLSFWGGFDLETGVICDHSHPQFGTELAGKVLVMRSGRGSSSASSVLAESIRSGLGPIAILIKDPDPILALGAIIAAELYGKYCPVAVLNDEYWDVVIAAKAVSISPITDTDKCVVECKNS